MNDQEILAKISRINVYKSGDRRAPHKPLLLLLALAKLQQGERTLSFKEVEAKLKPLLKLYAPPTRRQQPELPYWYLVNDGLWQLDNADNLQKQASGFPRIGSLRDTSGHLPQDVYDALASDPALFSSAVEMILDSHFPASLQDEILQATGIDVPEQGTIKEPTLTYNELRKRDPAFREKVLRAYEHRCAVTGFRAALGGSFFGCEAAHVQWHAHQGPDSVQNGLALEPTLHKLFDAGAWTLTDDRRVLVSSEFTGSDEAVVRLRGYHGHPIKEPLNTDDAVSVEYIRWHRERDLGGVFRQPALSL